MFLLITTILTCLILSTIMLLLALLISKKNKEDKEKMSPFECGFDPLTSSRLPFSIRFFLITIIFLIFDVEITIILPMPQTMYLSSTPHWMISSSLFLIILIIGLIHEWNQGALNWTY
uniref:NADH-ubiquinone oxidoreductase chain 3 n=1 Tax=Speleketor irwini TaxID=342007 RepID=A0A343QCI0_9NEOP|nr:NADH dehydrogenase subunit 3 [Speleketor irwini]ATU07127.1 NADH dehydrogenase subunit 3 [Speleketor irwini]